MLNFPAERGLKTWMVFSEVSKFTALNSQLRAIKATLYKIRNKEIVP